MSRQVFLNAFAVKPIIPCCITSRVNLSRAANKQTLWESCTVSNWQDVLTALRLADNLTMLCSHVWQ